MRKVLLRGFDLTLGETGMGTADIVRAFDALEYQFAVSVPAGHRQRHMGVALNRGPQRRQMDAPEVRRRRFIEGIDEDDKAAIELGAVKDMTGWNKGAHIALTGLTIVSAWTFIHLLYALHYAHEFYRGAKPKGLQFPSGETHENADYWDFVYFSFVIGMTAQVSDVGITDKTIRRTATVHGIISFVYNTALVALMVNIAASAISS